MTAPNDVAALVERLLKIADAALRDDGSDIPLGQDVRSAAATIAALQADAERYRYLRDNCTRRWVSNMGGADSLDIGFDAEGHDLDAAVDAARSASRKENTP